MMIPDSTTEMPPNQVSTFVMSLIVRSTASKQWRCYAGASSQMISLVSLIKSARADQRLIAARLSCQISKGILNLECNVRLLARRIEAISEKATARATWWRERTRANIKFSTKVLLVSSSLSMKNRPPQLASTAAMIVSIIHFYSGVIREQLVSHLSRSYRMSQLNSSIIILVILLAMRMISVRVGKEKSERVLPDLQRNISMYQRQRLMT